MFLYLSLDDLSSYNWICKTQWIHKDSPSASLFMKHDDEHIDDEIVIDWNEKYESLAAFFESFRIVKEDYLDTIGSILTATKVVVDQAIELTTKLSQKQTSEDRYLICMSELEPEAERFYLEATRIGSAPTECNDLSQRFQCVMAMVHNIFLPFSERGLEIWERSNRTYLVNQAIKDYQKDLLRLEFELEKVR